MNLMMLAAGEGTRLRPHTYHTPKPAIPFLNVPLAAWSLSLIGSTPINSMCVNTFHLAPKVIQLFQNLPLSAAKLSFSEEHGQILGSGGGLGKARSFLNSTDSILLMNSDEVILPEDIHFIEKALKLHEQNKNLSTLIVTEHPEVGTKFGGVWVDSQNKVIGFGKQRPLEAVKGWHFVGMQFLSQDIFDFVPTNTEANILYDGLMAGMQAGHQVQVYPIQCVWFETGNQVDFLSATSECLQILYNNPASPEGRHIQGVLNKYLGSDWQIEAGQNKIALIGGQSTISLGAELTGFVVIGNDCEVPAGASLENVVLGSHLKLNADFAKSNELVLLA